MISSTSSSGIFGESATTASGALQGKQMGEKQAGKLGEWKDK